MLKKITDQFGGAVAAIVGAIAWFIFFFLDAWSKVSDYNPTIAEELTLSILTGLVLYAIFERWWLLAGMKEDLDKLAETSGEWQPYAVKERTLHITEPLEKYIEGAQEVFVFGGNLFLLFEKEGLTLERWLSKEVNGKLLLLLLDPEKVKSGKIPVYQFHYENDPVKYAEFVERTLSRIKELQKRFPNRVQFHCTTHNPSVSVMMVDRKKARVSINLTSQRSTERWVLIVLREKHNEAFRDFEMEYRDHLWPDKSSETPH